jgi:hypothetical protein
MGLKAKINACIIWVYFFIFLCRKLCLKVAFLNQTTEYWGKNKVDTYGSPVFAPDCSATILSANIYTNSIDI